MNDAGNSALCFSYPLQAGVSRHQLLRAHRGELHGDFEVVALIFDGDDRADAELAMPHPHAGAHGVG